MNLSDAVERTEDFWRTLGDKCVNLVKRITDAGRDYKNDPFPPYSEGYIKTKSKQASGKLRNKTGRNPGAGFRQASTRINPPDLRFSGEMMRDFKRLEVNKTGVVLGWAVYGDRAEWNAEMGRAIIDFNSDTNPHPALTQAVHDALAIDTEKKLKAWARKPLAVTFKV